MSAASVETAAPTMGTDSSLRSRVVRYAGPLIATLLVGSAAGYYGYARGFETTDDAQIDGDITSVSARVSGTVERVFVVAGQHVHAGQLLAELDRTDLQVALARAEAAVALARAELAASAPGVALAEARSDADVGGANADIVSLAAAVASARSELVRSSAELERGEVAERHTQLQFNRAAELFEHRVVPRAELELRESALSAASANVRALREAVSSARERVTQEGARLVAARVTQQHATRVAPHQLEASQAAVEARRASLTAAEAELAHARNELAYASIVAPTEGIVGRKSVSHGDHVVSAQPLVALTQTSALWVTANFRETQIRRMRVGQTVHFHVDALDLHLTGKVESVGGATGARLSLFPPENAVGNYVKVVQRLPVRLAIDGGQPGIEQLRIGMSVEPRVELTSHAPG